VKPYLLELYGHQAWADAEHWRTIQAHPPALADPAIRKRLVHIHLVQSAFLWMVGPRAAEFAAFEVADFPDITDLKARARAFHAEFAALLDEISDERLSEEIDVPWFKDPPLRIRVEHALLQAAMHSHYHRGQNATRLRELGVEPPLTDFIAWLWRGRPSPDWT
jgi:uncharacterized damage-inducible protein DinB